VTRSFAPAIPLGGLVLAVAIAAGAGIAASPDSSGDETREISIVVPRHGDHGRVKPGPDARKELRKHGFDGRGFHHGGPRGFFGPGGPRISVEQLERSPIFALLPDALQDDARELVKADPEDRHALVDAITKKAADGEYGPKVQEAYELLQEHLGR
jgi:hypothetical protein